MTKKPLSRREFMRLGFTAAGGAAAMPVAALTDSLAAHNARGYRIGVLAPKATRAAGQVDNLLDGLMLGLGHFGAGIAAVEQIGVGRVAALKGAIRLLDSGVTTVIGLLSVLDVDTLQPLFAERKATLVVATTGENEHPAHLPNVVYSSLHYWQSAYAAGKWAAAAYGPRAFIASSFYESGFDTLLALHQGVEAAGGRVVDRAVTHLDQGDDRLNAAMRQIRMARPDFVYAAYRGDEAAAFAHAYHRAGLDVPLVASSFMDDAPEACVVGAWHGAVRSEENAAFAAAFRASTGRRADAFAVLGFDTGRWVASGYEVAGLSDMHEVLAATAIAGPRGVLRFDAAARALRGDLVLRRPGAALETLILPDVGLSRVVRSGSSASYLAL